MGFFSRIGKGIKSAFKSIGRGIKSAFKRFGKFMNKIGVLGQIAMMFILPGVGNMLASAWSGIAGQTAGQAAAAAAGQATATAAASGGSSAVASTALGKTAEKAALEIAKAGAKKGATDVAVKAAADLVTKYGTKATGLMAKEGFAHGVGKLMQFTGKVVGTPGRVFSNITQGVTETLGNFAKTASNNIFGSSFTTAAGETLSGKFFSGGDSAFGRSFGSTSKFANVLAKSPTIATKQAVANFTPGKGVLKPEFQSSVTEADMYKLPDTPTLRPNDAFDNLEVGMKPGGKLDLSRPVKDFNTAKFSEGDVPTVANAGTEVSAGGVSTVTNADDVFRNANALRNNQFRSSLLENVKEVRPLEDRESLIPERLQETLKNMYRQEDGSIDFTKKRGVLTTKNVNFTPEVSGDEMVKKPSLFENIKTGITGAPKRVMDKATAIAKDPLGYAFKGFEESIQEGIQYKAKEAIGLTPDMPDQYVTNSRAYVPTFDTGGGAGSYQAPETMNARAFEQNVLSAPNQYGYTAFQYDQYMNRTAQA